MVILSSNDEKAAATLEETRSEDESAQNAPATLPAPPPDYSEIGSTDAGGRAAVAAASGVSRIEWRNAGSQLPLKVRPTNFVVQVRTNEDIKGTLAVDPEMVMVLPPPEKGQTEETRPNLSLKSVNGDVYVDVYVLAVGEDNAQTRNTGQARSKSSPSSPRRQVIIHMGSENGDVESRIREIAPSSPSSRRRLPLNITQESLNGDVTVYLPLTFAGPVRAQTSTGTVMCSADVVTELTSFFDGDGVQRAFIGRFDPAHWVQKPWASWEGDELSIESRNGNLYIYYVDELDLPPKPTTGFFSRHSV